MPELVDWSNLLLYSVSQKSAFRFCSPFVHENEILFFRGHRECTPSGWCHQSTIFKIDASVHVELGPVTLLAARGETLCQAPIRKSLKCAVNPAEAECFFDHVNVGENSCRGSLAPGHDYPALLFLGVILLQPRSEL